MTEMQILLEQWFNVEPDRCRNAHSLSSRDTTDKEVCVSGDWQCVWDATAPFSIGDIQMALQEAIEARGWHYEMHWYGTEKLAYVYPPGVTQLIRFDTDSMAESLLRAYLQAIKLSGVTR